ncbi:hypothetical protein DFP72DRAFT_901759 [Ephemerocybe angulata]|uniref:MYND-type domain-containing protein n=1 Tax=Ephemerocybe angulata TaxID=980116 RepID=A0A8H6HUJ2_9AGAR|nr:hypothetical protein DFP72DRAFT_901759 [Tulosesus angulatus]
MDARNRTRGFNVLLDGVKRGSPSHIERLVEEWPADFDQACQAFSALLEHLKLEDVPPLHIWNQFGLESRNALFTVKCRTALQATLNGLEQMSGSDDATKSRVLEVLEPHLSGLISWATFFARRSAIPSFELPNAYAGTFHASWLFRRLLEYGLNNHPDNPSLSQLVESALNLWMWDPLDMPRGAKFASRMVLPLSASDYMKYIEPTNHLLLLCAMDNGTRRIALERINTLRNKEWRGQLTHSFNFRCDQWENTFKKDNKGGMVAIGAFFKILFVYQALSSGSAVLRKNLNKTPFLSKALGLVAGATLAWPNTEELCLPVEAVNLVFQPHFPNALAMTHTLPRVINSGLLHVIANALLVPSIKWPDGGDPLWRLYRLLYYPRVCDAVTSAINAMPDTTLKALSSIPDWKKFYGVASDLRNVYAAAPPRNEVPLCDNLFHPTMSHQVILKDTKGVQCSWCHTTVYCSRECQQKDWDLFHKAECTANRVERIDRQLHGGWLSHRTRALFLVLLRALLLHPGMPNIEDPLTIPWFDLRTYPHNMHQLDVEDMHNQLTDYGEDTFGDARSKAILNEFVEKGGTVRLAGFIAEFGEYHIFTLARFRRVEPGLGTAPRVWHSGLMPLGVHVRVLRRPWP